MLCGSPGGRNYCHKRAVKSGDSVKGQHDLQGHQSGAAGPFGDLTRLHGLSAAPWMTRGALTHRAQCEGVVTRWYFCLSLGGCGTRPIAAAMGNNDMQQSAGSGNVDAVPRNQLPQTAQ